MGTVLTLCSVEFLLVFLPIFIILYWLAPKRTKAFVLLAGSLVFYTLGDYRYLPFLALSMTVNYLIGLYLGRGKPKWKSEQRKLLRRKRFWLIAAVAGNVGALVLCKFGIGVREIPMGMSFYTFRVLAYLLDVYWEREESEWSFFRFGAYLIMFPCMTAGPITLIGQVREALLRPRVTLSDIQDGCKRLCLGLAAKVLLADRLGILWHDVQVVGFESLTTPYAWMGAIAFSLQLYLDFYGYSLMAIGIGQMLGFSLPDNFRTPYMSLSVREFYRRWHMTLGNFFCRYVYIPMGGSREGELCAIRNLLVVWVLTSLWHGTDPNFLIWGMTLCGLIVIERQVERIPFMSRLKQGWLSIIPRLYVWFVMPITWISFAVTDVKELKVYLGRMFGWIPGIATNPLDWRMALENYWYLLLVGLVCCTPLIRKLYQKWKDSVVGSVLLAVLFWVSIWQLQKQGQNPFLYFRF